LLAVIVVVTAIAAAFRGEGGGSRPLIFVEFSPGLSLGLSLGARLPALRRRAPPSRSGGATRNSASSWRTSAASAALLRRGIEGYAVARLNRAWYRGMPR